MIRKHFTLTDEEAEIIECAKEELHLKSDSEVIRYILRQYIQTERKEDGYVLAVLRGIEERVDLLLDVANTDLIKRNEEICYPVSMTESPVIKKARKLRKANLANKKQKADYRNRKKKG